MFSMTELRQSIALAVTKADARLRQILMAQTGDTPMTAPQWAGQHTNPQKNAWRKRKAQIGARQARRQARALRRLHQIDRQSQVN